MLQSRDLRKQGLDVDKSHQQAGDAWRWHRACRAGSRDRPGPAEGQGRRSRAETGTEAGQRAGTQAPPGAVTGQGGDRFESRRRHGDTAQVVAVVVPREAQRSAAALDRRLIPAGK